MCVYWPVNAYAGKELHFSGGRREFWEEKEEISKDEINNGEETDVKLGFIK